MHADKSIFDLYDEFAFFIGCTCSVVYLRHLAADEVGTFLQDPLVELLVAFEGRAHVDIEVVYFGAGAFMDKVGEFQSLHATNDRAVLVVVLIPATHAVDDTDRLGSGFAIAQHDITVRWSGSVAHPFELKTGKDIRQASIAVLSDAACVERLVASC